MSVSLLFPAYDRLEFTRQSWAALMANTDWSLVSEFHVYDDGSTDGTLAWLEDSLCSAVMVGKFADVAWMRRTTFCSPMGVTLDWIKRSRAPILAKLDNDTIYPPGWLNIALDVMNRNPKLDMLGLEAMREVATLRPRNDWYAYHEDISDFGYERALFVSGLGLYRRAIFADSLPEDLGYFGLEEWQQRQRGRVYGWIKPSLPVILLDRLPMEPWRSLSDSYIERGWQRPWSADLRYKPEQHALWDWWRPVE